MNQYTHAASNRERIRELRQLYPKMTLLAIGNELGISKERVRQILVEENLPTVSVGQSTTKAKEIQPCIECGNLNKEFNYKHSTYCSQECVNKVRNRYWEQFHKDNPNRRTTFQCSYCGKDKTIRTTLYKQQLDRFKNLYCSHSCSTKAQWDDENSAMRKRHSQLNPKDLT